MRAGHEVVAALRACRLWRDADDDAVAALASRARVRDFAADEQVAAEGEPADSFGVVLKGSARVYQLTPDGRRLTIEQVRYGEAVLAVAALARGRYPANLEAETDLELVWLPRDALFDLIEADPRAARGIATDLANRVVRLTTMVQSLSLDVPARLARFLFQRSLATGAQTPDGLEIEIGMSKTALAEALGTVPETLSRALGRLRDEGLLETSGRSVVVLDVGGLARRGAGYGSG